MLFWRGADFENRLKNAIFCLNRLKHFALYANNMGLDVDVLFFDFSSNKSHVDGAIHIPCIPGSFMRSEKLNMVIEYNYLFKTPDLFCVLDSDVFFMKDDYDKLIFEISNLNKNTIINGNVLDIKDGHSIDLTENTISMMNVTTNIRVVGGLGGFFIIDFNELFNSGGYDERFTIWGGEDDDIAHRLKNNGLCIKKTNVTLYHLPHISLMQDAHKTQQYHDQCTLIGNNDTITKYSLITKKYLNKRN